MYIQSFRELIVWQKAVELAKEVYLATERFPGKEVFGLQSQMRRAAVSIASNIAEGHRRGTKRDFLQFLRISDGSTAEIETQMTIAKAIYKTCDFSKVDPLLMEVQKMLSVMIKKIEVAAATSKR